MNPGHYEPGTCANCDGTEVTVKSPLFCSPGCRQAAELVRYVRKARAEGRDQRPDIREAIQMRVAHVLAGGYPEAERRVPENLRQEVFRRAGGHCESCGRELDFGRLTGDPDAVATIQHISGSSNELDNLAAFCSRCNTADAQSHFVPVEAGSAEDLLARQLTDRWSAPEPMRLCDDQGRWKDVWRSLERDARELVREREDPEEGVGDEDLPGFSGWTDQGTPVQEL